MITKKQFFQNLAISQLLVLIPMLLASFIFLHCLNIMIDDTNEMKGYVTIAVSVLLGIIGIRLLQLNKREISQKNKEILINFLEASEDFNRACRAIRPKFRNHRLNAPNWVYVKDVWYINGNIECPMFRHQKGYHAIVADGLAIIFYNTDSLKKGLESFDIYEHDDRCKVIEEFYDTDILKEYIDN